GLVEALISRAHRFDVYEERKRNHYMPLKRQFVKDIARISAISKKGKDYLCHRYGIPENTVAIDRLGVGISNKVCPPNDSSLFVILSVSYCVEVKNIQKIIEAIEIVANKNQ